MTREPYYLIDVPQDVLERLLGHVPPANFPSDGCTCAPDVLLGFDLHPACLYHDWVYFDGGTEEQRLAGDQNLYRNLQVCGLPHEVAGVYYRRVRLEGIKFFAFYPPLTRWQRLRLYVRCFFTRYFIVPEAA
jgi:hypothetical protein